VENALTNIQHMFESFFPIDLKTLNMFIFVSLIMNTFPLVPHTWGSTFYEYKTPKFGYRLGHMFCQLGCH